MMETLLKKAMTVIESSQEDAEEDREIGVIPPRTNQTKSSKSKLNKSNYLKQTTSKGAIIDNKQVNITKKIKKGVSRVKHMSYTSARRKKRNNRLKKLQLLIWQALKLLAESQGNSHLTIFQILRENSLCRGYLQERQTRKS